MSSTSLGPSDAIDLPVRRIVYDGFITEGISLPRSEVAARLSLPETDVAAAFRRLAQAHVLVLQPESGEVLMANPFSSVPTAFRVTSGLMHWWGNCIWDALGILAMIAQDGAVVTSCPDCGEGVTLSISAGRLPHADGIVHFAVPAAHWWDDIVFT
ncbi:MAG TPA: organomercurial lyase [Anaerolineales bacterium]|nr:organomercurial lyase [Anaerolineales bacterium]